MSTVATPIPTAPATGLPACPWWCTAEPGRGHDWQLAADGGWTRLHRRQVGGFTMFATERVGRDNRSTVELHPTQADFDTLRTAADAAELSENLHQVAAILRQIESGPSD